MQVIYGSGTSTLRVIQGSIHYGYNQLLCEHEGSGVSEWAVCFLVFFCNIPSEKIDCFVKSSEFYFEH